jgi:hypothetical protein
VKEMLTWREDIFNGYTEEFFQAAFEIYFLMKKKTPVPGSLRVLYYFQKQL